MKLRALFEHLTTNFTASLLLAAICGTPALAGDVVEWAVADGGNGHSYEAVFAPNTPWITARNEAAQRIYNGSTGYLATFATASEQAWVTAALGGGTAINSLWLGGYQDFNDPAYSEPSGGWKWITGEPFLLSGSDAPIWSFNDAYYIPGGEQYTCTWWNTGGINDFNDIAPGVPDNHGYIVEYNPVPEPSCLVLLSLGAATLWRRRRASR